MSIIQASVFSRHAIVVADTWTHYHDEHGEKVGAGHGSKLLTVPHMPAVIAMRGYSLLPSMVAGSAFMAPDFDTLVNGFEATMGVAMERVSEAFPAARGLMHAAVEVVLVGWSARARMMLAFYAQKAPGEAFTLTEFRSSSYAPPPYADGTMPPEPGDMEDRVAIARLQAARIKAETDGAAGGDLVAATLTRNGINLEVVRGFTTGAAGASQAGGKALAAGMTAGNRLGAVRGAGGLSAVLCLVLLKGSSESVKQRSV